MELTVTTRYVSGVVVLDMTGRLWILDLPLRDLIKTFLDTGQRHFVLNLTDLTYVDSSGLGQMLAIWTSINTKGGHMTLLRPSPRVRTLLELTRLGTVFEIFEDEDSAVAAARKPKQSFDISA
jgi:anti-sigma B factor antagonist